jgi:hypothetical protein
MSTSGDGTLSWIPVATGDPTYMMLTNQQVHPKNALWHDILVGGTSTSSATIALQANTGQILANHLGLSTNGYLNFGSTLGTSGYGIRDNAGTIEYKNSGGSWSTLSSLGDSVNYWQLNSGALSPFSTTADLLIGATATASAKFAFNAELGNYIQRSSVTTGIGFSLTGNSLTSGELMSLSSNSITNGALLVLTTTSNSNPTGLISNINGMSPKGIDSTAVAMSNGGTAIAGEFISKTSSGDPNDYMDLIGIKINLEAVDSSVNDSFGILITTPEDGGQTWLNNYGLYINDQSATAYNNSYNLYSAGSTAKNYFAGHVEIGNELRLVDGTGSYYTGFKAPADLTGTQNYVYTLPADYGSNNQVLTTNGSGALTWTTPAGGPGGDNYWQLVSGAIAPFSVTADLLVGSTASTSANLVVAGSLFSSGDLFTLRNNTNTAGNLLRIQAGATPTDRLTLSSAGELRLYDTTAADYLSLSHDGTNAQITTNAGNITIGSGAGDFALGEDGTQVDLLFAESGLIKAATGKFITMTDIGTITPDATTTYDLGSSSLRWDDVFAANANLSNELRLVDGTGSYYTGFKAPADLTGTQNYVYTLPADYGSNGQVLTTNGAGALTWTTVSGGPGGDNYWQLAGDGKVLAPFNTTLDFAVGGTATASALFRVAGITPTTGNAMSLAANSLTTGTGFNLSSTSTALTTGSLMRLNWEPTSPATASGDLFSLNIGAHGDLTGNLFRITRSGSDLFKVSTSKITSAIPHEFLAAGDVSVAYDIVLTNQTASMIDSYGPLTIRAGEIFESNNLKLQTFNSGNILLEPAYGGKVVVGTGSATLKLSVSDAQPATAAAIIENVHAGTDADGLIVKLGYTGNANANNSFITFLNGNGVIHGKIHGSGSTGVTYKTSGLDFAEYFVKDGSTFIEGELVAVSGGGATKTSTAYQTNMIGIVSKHPGFTGGIEGPDKVLVGIIGQVPVLISPNSAPIQAGDLLTSSNETSRAQKATRPGHVVGKALESWAPGSGKDSILVYINPGYGDPNHALAFDASGNLNFAGNLAINGNLLVQGRNILDDLNTLQATTNSLTTQVNGIQAAIGSINNELASINYRIDKMDESFFTGRLGVGIDAPASDSGKLIDTSSGAYLSESGVWTNVSDENKKENYTSIDKDLILDQIANLRITQWNYISDGNNIVHIGPTAQDFHATFGLGQDNKTISTIDPASIALVGVQALNEKFNKLAAAVETGIIVLYNLPTPTPTIDPLIARIESLEATVATLSANTTQSPDLSIDDVLSSTESALLAGTSIEMLEYDILKTDLELLKQDLEIASLSASLARPAPLDHRIKLTGQPRHLNRHRRHHPK